MMVHRGPDEGSSRETDLGQGRAVGGRDGVDEDEDARDDGEGEDVGVVHERCRKGQLVRWRDALAKGACEDGFIHLRGAAHAQHGGRRHQGRVQDDSMRRRPAFTELAAAAQEFVEGLDLI